MAKWIFLVLWPTFSFAHFDRPETTFERGGNLEVVSRYKTFVSRDQHCAPVSDGPRVILTGFGIWDNSSISYSGYLVDNLSDPRFWSEEDIAPFPIENYAAHDGRLGIDEGARIVNRAFRLANGQKISACLIVVDVLWDFAGAVVATEMDRFQPQSVVMTGVGPQDAVEGGALNLTSRLAGYYPNGTSDDLNRPISRTILPDEKVNQEIPMTWDLRKVASAAKIFKPDVIVHQKAELDNNYICNNVSYIALEAANGRTLQLADGDLVLKPDVRSRPNVGFFHFDNRTTGELETLKANAQMILAVIEATLDSN
jgi:hypothetical protein